MGQNTETTDSPAKARPRWSNKVKWGIRGIVILSGLLILWMACLISIAYLGAVEPVRITHSRPALLDPDSGPEAQGDEKLQSKGTPQVTVAANHPTSGTTLAHAGPRPQFKPLINSNPVLMEKMKGHREALNQRFDAVLVRIAKYETMKEAMDLDTTKKELAAIHGEFMGIVGELVKLLGWKNDVLGEAKDELSISVRIMDYLQWQQSAQASLDAKENRYELAAIHIKAARRWQELANALNPDQAATFSSWDFHHSEPYQELWNQEIYYWRKVGGMKSIKKIGEVVIQRKFIDLSFSIK